ncbi:hypothetical protein B0H13DRAFT_2354477 [Mycena leptocephala]|nr:hypothetical protein B0H13DRAFT_2354477 [Mycena leptocephala]
MDVDADVDMDVDLTLMRSDDEEEDEDEREEDEGDDDEDEEDQEDDESEEEEEEEVKAGTKRKREGSSKISAKAPPPHEIEYKISMYTARQMQKAKSSRGHPITEIVTLYSNKPWPTFKTNLLTKINTALKPHSLNFFDYSITFTVPRQVSDPIQLTDHTKYEYLLKKVLLIQKNPTAEIVVEPKAESIANNKENGANGDEDDTTTNAKKGGKKTKVPKARDILPANVALNERMGELRERWICPTPGGACGSAHCFSSPTEPEHFPLSHAHFESWGAAMLKGKAFADLDTPPNNKLFDQVATAARAVQSPLLQRRLELKEEAARKNAPAAPQVHINFPPEIANLLRPAAPPPPAAVPNVFIPPPNTANMLIPYPRIPGPDLSIEDFCSLHNLDTDICDRFKQNKYKRTNAFKFVEVDDLKAMGFMRGEIAELTVAIGGWSQLPSAE